MATETKKEGRESKYNKLCLLLLRKKAGGIFCCFKICYLYREHPKRSVFFSFLPNASLSISLSSRLFFTN